MNRASRSITWQRCVEKPLAVFLCVVCFGLTDAVESSTKVPTADVRYPDGNEPSEHGQSGKGTFQTQLEQLAGAYNLSDTTSSSNSARDTSISHNSDYQPRASERFHVLVDNLKDGASDDEDVHFEVDDISVEADGLPVNLPKVRRPRGLSKKKAFVAAVAPLALFSQVVIGTRVRDAILEEESDDVDGRIGFRALDPYEDSPQQHRSTSKSSSMDTNASGRILGAAVIGAALAATAIVFWLLSRIRRPKWGSFSRHEGVLHPRSAKWDLERCLLLVDVGGARDAGYLGGAFVAGTSQITVDIRAQEGTLSYSLIPLFSVDPVAFIRRQRRVVREHFKIPTKSCWVRPHVTVRDATPSNESTHSGLQSQERRLPRPRSRNRRDGGLKEHKMNSLATGSYMDTGSSVLVQGVPTIVGEVNNISEADAGKSRVAAEAFKDIGTREPFVREFTSEGFFDDKVNALVIQLEHSPGPQPVAHRKSVMSPPPELLRKITTYRANGFQDTVEVERSIKGFPGRAGGIVHEAPALKSSETASVPQWAAKRHEKLENETTQHGRAETLCVEAATLNVNGDICTWDFAVRDKRELSVFAEVESQSLIISAVKPQTYTTPLQENEFKGIYVIHTPPECMLSSPHYVAFSRGMIRPLPVALSSVQQRSHSDPGFADSVRRLIHKNYNHAPSDELQHLRIQVRSLPQSRAFRRIRRLHRVFLSKK